MVVVALALLLFYGTRSLRSLSIACHLFVPLLATSAMSGRLEGHTYALLLQPPAVPSVQAMLRHSTPQLLKLESRTRILSEYK